MEKQAQYLGSAIYNDGSQDDFFDIFENESEDWKPFIPTFTAWQLKDIVGTINDLLEEYHAKYKAGERAVGFDKSYNLILNTLDELGVDTEFFREMFASEFMYGGSYD